MDSTRILRITSVKKRAHSTCRVFPTFVVCLALTLLSSCDKEAKSKHPYICINGTPVTGDTEVKGTEKCESCAAGFTLSANQICLNKSSGAGSNLRYNYMCEHGEPVEEKADTPDMEKCDTCDPGYTKTDSHTCVESDSGPNPPTSETCDVDYDGDRLCDDLDEDDDNDGIPDTIDNCRNGRKDWRSGIYTDRDEDGCYDGEPTTETGRDGYTEELGRGGEDPDVDEDGLNNIEDKCDDANSNTRWERNEDTDMDGDGCRDITEDPDDDGDGEPDICSGPVPHCYGADIDDDNDGLIEIHTLEMFHNIRYNLAGTSYDDEESDTPSFRSCDYWQGSTTGSGGTRCGAPKAPTVNCKVNVGTRGDPVYLCGYELASNLSFAVSSHYAEKVINPDWHSNNRDPAKATNAGFPGLVSGETYFNAIFEGNGHTISHLYMRNSDTSGGLFNRIGPKAIIRNLGVVNVNLYSIGTNNYHKVGGLVGINNGKIVGSYTSGNIVRNDGAGNYLGGLVGENSGTIKDSHAEVEITGGPNSGDTVGGLVGRNVNSTIIASYATGDVDGGFGDDKVGGLVGENDRGPIIASYATGDVDGGLGDDNVGGLVGENDRGGITASYATGGVYGGLGNDHVGGLVGECSGASSTNSIISASYSIGNAYGDAGDYDRVGGLVGTCSGTSITASYATGTSDGGVGTRDNVGPLIGDPLIGSNSGGTITASYGFADAVDTDARGLNINALHLRPANCGAASEGSTEGTNPCTPQKMLAPGSSPTHSNEEWVVPPSWNQDSSNTSNAWNFSDTLPPRLAYGDYDGSGGTNYCQEFGSRCGELLPGQDFDQDNDGIPDEKDKDDDDDGWTDTDEEACGTDPRNDKQVPEDTDRDRLPSTETGERPDDRGCNALDTDDDGDGVSDRKEIRCGSDPLDGRDEPTDSDLDGTCDTLDDDDDGDGFSDAMELACGKQAPDTRNSRVVPADENEDGVCDYLERVCGSAPDDADGDGVCDRLDIDDDNDGLIEIHDLEMFYNIRHNLAGTSYRNEEGFVVWGNTGISGAPTKPYKARYNPDEDRRETLTAPNCPAIANTSVYLCGYELSRDLDFADATSYALDRDNSNGVRTVNPSWRPTDDDGDNVAPLNATNAGFPGIHSSTGNGGGFNAIFDGNGHTIFNLYMRNTTGTIQELGLFRNIESGAIIRNLGIMNARVYNGDAGWNVTGALVGNNKGRIMTSYAGGHVCNTDYASSHVENHGGGTGVLVGVNSGTIIASYARPSSPSSASNCTVALVGASGLTGNEIIASYVIGGILINRNSNTAIIASLSTGTEFLINNEPASDICGASCTANTFEKEDGNWDVPGSHTADAWEFGDENTPPRLQCADYDGPPTDPASTIGKKYYCYMCPGATCGVMLPGQVDSDGDGTVDLMDVDDDNDGLIEIHSLNMLHHVRHNPDGNSYKNSADALGDTTGAPTKSYNFVGNPVEVKKKLTAPNCTDDDGDGKYLCGYELSRNLDFATAYSSGSIPITWLPTNSNGNIVNPESATNPGFPSLSSKENPFNAIFEGKGHSISNFYMRNVTGDAGFFEAANSKAIIRNLGLENVYVHASNRDASICVGGLVGRTDATITHTYVTGSVNLGRHSSNVDSEWSCAGLLAGGQSDGGATITNSYARGEVSASASRGLIGGLVGRFNGAITNSYAEVTVNTNGSGSMVLGGLVGRAVDSAIIRDSYATGAVSGDNGEDHVGGLVGELENVCVNSVAITGSYATGAVSGDDGNDKVGGLVGKVGKTGTSCSSLASITASYATGTVSGDDGNDRVGGLVGLNDQGTIAASYAIGVVSGGLNEDRVGGLVGLNDQGTITASYAIGIVSGDKGEDHVGGLVGLNDQGSITATYATGNVSGNEQNDKVGGLVGLNDRCKWERL